MRRIVRQHVSRGFTLIELIATMAVVGALGSIAASIMIAAIGGLMQATTSAQLHTELSIAMDRIDAELRNIPLDGEASDIAPNIKYLAATTITWDGSNTLSLVGSELQLSIEGGDPVVLLTDVSAFEMKAYDESNATMALPVSGAGRDGVRRIQVDVTATRDGVSERLRTKVYLRCTMAGE